MREFILQVGSDGSFFSDRANPSLQCGVWAGEMGKGDLSAPGSLCPSPQPTARGLGLIHAKGPVRASLQAETLSSCDPAWAIAPRRLF